MIFFLKLKFKSIIFDPFDAVALIEKFNHWNPFDFPIF